MSVSPDTQHNPTQADIVAAAAALRLTDVDLSDMRDWERRNLRAVAALVASIHARYETVAKAQRESCEQWWQEANGAEEPDLSYARGRQHASDQAAYAIRLVPTQ